ncbi:MAG: outer membrane beta-barrel protein [Gemmatimonadota bacterium]
MTSISRICVALLATTGSAGTLTAVQAQRLRDGPAISVMAGPSHYDLSETGTALAAGLRLDIPSGRSMIVEIGATYLKFQPSQGPKVKYLLPEVSLQYVLPGAAIRPYVGGGIGEGEFLSGPGTSKFTMHATGGVRAMIANGWGLRGEFRARSVDPFRGHTLDLSFGVLKRFR